MSDTTCTHHPDSERTACPVCLVTAITTERDQLRAEVELDEALQLATERSLKNAIARAERAEAALADAKEECKNVRLKWHAVMGTCAAKQDAIMEADEELVCLRARAERAEADAAAYLKRAESFRKISDEAEAELATERARLADLVADLNDACITLESAKNDCDDYAMQNTEFKLMAVRNVLLQYIPNAAMKEGAK